MNASSRQRLAWALAFSTGIILALLLVHPRGRASERAQKAASQSAQDLLDDDTTPDLDTPPVVADLSAVLDSTVETSQGIEPAAEARNAGAANQIPLGHSKIPDADDPPSALS